MSASQLASKLPNYDCKSKDVLEVVAVLLVHRKHVCGVVVLFCEDNDNHGHDSRPGIPVVMTSH